jgi:outer membrane protein OmpU
MNGAIGAGAGMSTGPQAVAAGTSVAGICGFQQAANPNNCPTADYSYQDLFDVGANYLNKFGDLTVALYGAFAYSSFVPGYMPFGGALGWDNNGAGGNYYTGVDNDTRFYTAGIMYETGPWQMSFMWAGFYNTNGNGSASAASITPGGNVITANIASAGGVPGQNSTAFNGNASTAANFGVESAQKFEVGANYALGPGIKAVGGFMYNNIAGPSNAVSGNSWVVMLGMDLRF